MATQRQEQIVRKIVKFSVFQGDPENLLHTLDVAENREKANHVKIVVVRPASEGGINLPFFVLKQAGYSATPSTDGVSGVIEYNKHKGLSLETWLDSTLTAIALFSEKMYRGLDVVDVLFLKKIG